MTMKQTMRKQPLLGSRLLTSNILTTIEELLEMVFSVVRTAAVATQWCAKHVSAATVEP
jgi:hypothetical protein